MAQAEVLPFSPLSSHLSLLASLNTLSQTTLAAPKVFR